MKVCFPIGWATSFPQIFSSRQFFLLNFPPDRKSSLDQIFLDIISPQTIVSFSLFTLLLDFPNVNCQYFSFDFILPDICIPGKLSTHNVFLPALKPPNNKFSLHLILLADNYPQTFSSKTKFFMEENSPGSKYSQDPSLPAKYLPSRLVVFPPWLIFQALIFLKLQ